MRNRILTLIASFVLAVTTVHAGSFSERKAKERADSAKPVAVKGGENFVIEKEYDATFDAIVRALKLADESVSLADREAGLIATELEITGKGKQTGTRTVVSLIKDTDTHTIVKVMVTKQSRYKVLQTEPWSDPVLDKERTPGAAAKLKSTLGGTKEE